MKNIKKILIVTAMTVLTTTSIAEQNPYKRTLTFDRHQVASVSQTELRLGSGITNTSSSSFATIMNTKAGLSGQIGREASPGETAMYVSDSEGFMAMFSCQNVDVPYFESKYSKISFSKSERMGRFGLGVNKTYDTQKVCTSFNKVKESTKFQEAYLKFFGKRLQNSNKLNPKSVFQFLSLFINKGLLEDPEGSDFIMSIATGDYEKMLALAYRHEVDEEALMDFRNATTKEEQKRIYKFYEEATSPIREEKRDYEASTIYLKNMKAIINEKEIDKAHMELYRE